MRQGAKRPGIMTEQRKAVALISGGLDSMLAARVIQDQGIHVEGLNFYTGFCVEGHTHAIRQKDSERPKRNNALWVAEQLGIKLHIVDVIDEYKDVVLNPRYGYGSNLNPCLDCKIFMVRKALAWSFMEEHGFDFIITGEVMGQRPMSQRKQALPLIARQSGAEDRLLRPLCAHHLPETLPEREGWVDRTRLHRFHGRNRKPQLALAREFGFTEGAPDALIWCGKIDLPQLCIKMVRRLVYPSIRGPLKYRIPPGTHFAHEPRRRHGTPWRAGVA
jgi:tRNA-uridine 2-sulfurtransferase